MDLAHEHGFALGCLWVDPPLRLVRNGDRVRSVEPRVMQVFVALAGAGGRPLSRDDLMQACWGGVVVGDNAIQRAISQARNIAATIGEGSFEIETVRGVGYRLLESGSDGDRRPANRAPGGGLSRRSWLALLGVGAVAVAVPAAIFAPLRSGASSAARALFDRAQVALRDEGFPSVDQAISLLVEAVHDSPEFAAAWGELALAYCASLFDKEGDQADHSGTLALQAARRALTLDPDLPSARTAMVMVGQNFHDSRKTRRELEAVADDGVDHWGTFRALGMVASDLGDWGSTITDYRRALDLQPLLPRVQSDLARAYWAAGRMMEAEATLADANRQWPRNHGIWDFSFRYLALTGQHERAAAYLGDDNHLPLGLGPVALERRSKLIDALDGGPGRSFVIRTFQEEALLHPVNIGRIAPVFAMLGAEDEMFELLDGYVFGRGRFAAKPSRFARRPTSFLFLPPMRRLHQDRRFRAILGAIGLA